VLLPEAAVVGIALDRKRIAHLIAEGRIQEGELVLRGLRRGVDRAPALIQHLQRGRRGGAEEVGGAGEIDVEFAAVTEDAHIRIDAAQFRWRTIAPAVVVERVGGDVERRIALPHADLRHGGAAPIRAAEQLDLAALIVEAVLHLD
jgi:hypothetical protein